jgi:uncharacterized protein (UPF0262 family)
MSFGFSLKRLALTPLRQISRHSYIKATSYLQARLRSARKTTVRELEI